MTMQRLCHPRTVLEFLFLAWLCAAGPALGAPPVNDYPTAARVEYVNECIATSGDKLSNLYQCACTIDRIAARLTYDEFVAAGTYAKYAALPGEGGGIFRDSAEAKKMAKLFREVQSAARRSCGLAP